MQRVLALHTVTCATEYMDGTVFQIYFNKS